MTTHYIKVETRNLRLGMFIAELDRPWLDTPFLIQGFLLDDEQDRLTLQRLCRHVQVDVRRSAIDLSSLARQAESPPQTLEALFTTPYHLRRGIREDVRAYAAQGLAPPGVALTWYVKEAPFEQELPRANSTYIHTREALTEVVQNALSGNDLHIDRVDEVVDDMVASMISNPDAMMWAARLRKEDTKTYAHGIRVSVYLLALGRHLGFPTPELHQLGMAGLLLDLGKINTPRHLLDKRGKLTLEEFEEIKRHVDHGLELLSGSPALHDNVLEGIAQHHERLSGRGYPRGLRGDEIGIFGRMAGIADTFAALTSPRPYESTISPSEALSKLYEASGEYFHRPLIERFVQAIGAFPVGSLVELSTGEIAVVVRHNRVRRLQPSVLLITNPSKQPLERPMGFDLLYQQSIGKDAPVRIRCGLPADAYDIDMSSYYIDRAFMERQSSPRAN